MLVNCALGTRNILLKLCYLEGAKSIMTEIINGIEILKSSMEWQMFVALVGGLGLFLYGMNLMSEGLEKAAGHKLKSIVG